MLLHSTITISIITIDDNEYDDSRDGDYCCDNPNGNDNCIGVVSEIVWGHVRHNNCEHRVGCCSPVTTLSVITWIFMNILWYNKE